MIWWTASAFGAPLLIGEADFRQLVTDLVPVVERAAGRPLRDPVQIGIVNRPGLQRLQDEAPPSFAPRPEIDGTSELAVYVPNGRGLYLVSDNVVQLVSDYEIPADQVRQVIRCLAAHELVHALQDQYETTPRDLDPDHERGWTALLEGHATQVGTAVCEASEGPGIARLAETFQGVTVPGMLDPSDRSATYALGRGLVRALDQEDPELVWAALSAPAPSWDDLVHDIAPPLAGGWSDTEPLVGALTALGADDTSLHAAPPGMLARHLGVRDWRTVPSASVGWGHDGDDVTLFAFRLDDAAAAADLLDHRATRLDASVRQFLMLTELDGPLKSVDARPFAPLERDGQRAFVGTFRGIGHRAVEIWVARDHVLVVAGLTDPASNAAAIGAVLDGLVDRLSGLALPRPVAFDRLAPWADAVRARRPAPAVTSGEWRLGAAALAWAQGADAPCGPAFADALAPGAVPDPTPWARDAYRCAALTADLSTASAAAAVHARALLDANRAADALAIVARAAPTGDADVREALGVERVRALADLRRWDEVVTVARASDRPYVAVQAAVDLWNSGRTRPAVELLAGACPSLDPKPEPCAALTR